MKISPFTDLESNLCSNLWLFIKREEFLNFTKNFPAKVSLYLSKNYFLRFGKHFSNFSDLGKHFVGNLRQQYCFPKIANFKSRSSRF